jgi:hypothetical protein
MTSALRNTSSVLAVVATALLANVAAAQNCPKGQEINSDTAGHCCWPGQAWSKSRGTCIGIPVCGPGYKVQGESCQREACPEMQYINDDTQDHCCWAGQVWSNAKSRCVGVPQMCPGGSKVLGEDCAPLHCEAGQERTNEGACCWPGQRWSASVNACVGNPNKCPSGMSSQPEGCVSLGWTTFDGVSTAAPEVAGGEAGPESWTPPPLLDAFRAPPQAMVQAAPTPIVETGSGVPQTNPLTPPEEPKGPRKGRTTLMLGLLLNDGFAGAFQIRASPRLFSILAETSFKGTGVLLIEPWLWIGGKADRNVGWFRSGLDLNLGAGWEQTLGPIEATVRVGVLNGLSLRTLVGSDASALAFNYDLKAVLGLMLAVPSGEGAKFTVGFDAYLGATPLFLVCIGVAP